MGYRHYFFLVDKKDVELVKDKTGIRLYLPPSFLRYAPQERNTEADIRCPRL